MRTLFVDGVRLCVFCVMAATVELGGASPLEGQGSANDSGMEFFEKRIRPVLVEYCYECHSARARSVKGGLSLDTRAGMLRGGDSGPAIEPLVPNESLLIEAIRHQSLEMPPDGKLPDDVIANFVQWIGMGAPDPRDAEARDESNTAKTWQQTMALRSRHWCWQPIDNPVVPAGPIGDESNHPVDRFIHTKLKHLRLSPAPLADRRELIRRVKFVLLGLPPTPDEIEAFVNHPADDEQAWTRLVDRYLASSAFGERWARHWMDVVRYAETHGSEHDAVIPKAWRYRDYLIRAFNQDVPYDRLVREHIAGDLPDHARWDKELGINEARLATAWLRMTEFYHSPVDVKNEEVAVIDNLIDTFGKAFQAQTLSCARCHDHKFDAISSEDFYALYGIFASSRQGMLICDRPESFHERDDQLRELKRRMRPELALIWRDQVAHWPTAIRAAVLELQQNDSLTDVSEHLKNGSSIAAQAFNSPEAKTMTRHWVAALTPKNPYPRQHTLFPLTELVRLGKRPLHEKPDVSFAQQWSTVAQDAVTSMGNRHSDFGRVYEVFADLRRTDDLARWHGRGPGFARPRCSPAGSFTVSHTGLGGVSAIYPEGIYSHLLSERHGGSLRSPDFTIHSRFISALVVGQRGSRLRLVVENFQGDAILFATAMPRLKDYRSPRWVRIPIRKQWMGRRAYLELLGHDDDPYVGIIGKDKPGMDRPSDGRSTAGLIQVVFHDEEAAPSPDFIWDRSLWDRSANSQDDVVGWFVKGVADAIADWKTGNCSDGQARLLDTLLNLELLDSRKESHRRLAALVDQYRRLERTIPVARRVPGVMDEGSGSDTPFFPRGNHRFPGRPVQRRYLNVLGPHLCEFESRSGSGRRNLARVVASPDNPLTARVMVNRLWHWTFGRGIVSTVDNFGSMGQAPSHPELLEYLAHRFVASGWSVKQMIRFLVTSRTFRAVSHTSPPAAVRDPRNRFYQHANLRRLEAESIRDAILASAGSLDRRMFGPSVPVWLAESHIANHKPKSGPLDGNGRRSIYIEVRRNNPSAFLEVFDRPKPNLTTGRRDVTNVPAQSLTLLNDPFVLQQSRAWASALLQKSAGQPMEQIIAKMFTTALGRPPTKDQLARARKFLQDQAAAYGLARGIQDPRPLSDLAHALFNHKEFIFIQ